MPDNTSESTPSGAATTARRPKSPRRSRLERVYVGSWSLDAYRTLIGDDGVAVLRELAEPLRGLRVLNLNATPYGGGVAELLRSNVPLLQDLGVDSEWRIISGDQRFFSVTKAIHNGLQGAAAELTPEQKEIYMEVSERNAKQLGDDYDVIVVHDPQPAALLGLASSHMRDTRWVWRCHIDTSEPNPAVWDFMRPHLEGYDAAVFTLDGFVPPDLPITNVEVAPPWIDPLSPKNLPIADETCEQILDWIGIDLKGPLITQVSRFDPWKDPLGVIAAYRMAREKIPNLQLALVGSMALDDPEGWNVYHEVLKASREDELIDVFTNLTGVGNMEVNAFQRLSSVVVQKSTREGFGLVVSEALWKSTPVVAGRAGGIPEQMPDGIGGYLVDSVEECANAIIHLLEDPQHARELARKGHQRVREHFILPRRLHDQLELLRSLTGVS